MFIDIMYNMKNINSLTLLGVRYVLQVNKMLHCQNNFIIYIDNNIFLPLGA